MLELTTSAMFLLSLFYGTTGANEKPIDAVLNSTNPIYEDVSIVDGVALIATTGNATTVESQVREYFKDAPILAEIAKCESQFRHIGADGEIIKGKVNKGDLGVMQINKYYHEEEAQKLGLDLTTLKDNMTYAKVLYDKFGTSPWQSSSDCWQKYKPLAKK